MMRCIVLLALALALQTSAIAGTPWEQYLDRPSPQAASTVRQRSYTQGSGDASRGTADDLQILALQVYAGDKQALELTLRLSAQADGGDLEDLYAIAGHAIRGHPRTFLEAVVAAKVSAAALAIIVQMPGLEYSDRADAMAYELQQRSVALMGVHDRALRSAREVCLDALRHNGI